MSCRTFFPALAACACLAAQSQAQAQNQPISIGRPQLPLGLRSYAPPSIPEIRLGNSNRLSSLIRAGNLYLSVQDALALAIENNLDLEIDRYGPLLAQSALKRAEAGGPIRGVPSASVQRDRGYRREWQHAKRGPGRQRQQRRRQWRRRGHHSAGGSGDAAIGSVSAKHHDVRALEPAAIEHRGEPDERPDTVCPQLQHGAESGAPDRRFAAVPGYGTVSERKFAQRLFESGDGPAHGYHRPAAVVAGLRHQAE